MTLPRLALQERLNCRSTAPQLPRSGFRAPGDEDMLRVAFHSARDAVEFCLELQRQLRSAR